MPLIDSFWPNYIDPHQTHADFNRALHEVLERLRDRPRAIDIETQGALEDQSNKAALSYRNAVVVGLSVCWYEQTFVPFEHLKGKPPIDGGVNGCWPSVYIPLKHQLTPGADDDTWDLIRWLLDASSVKFFHSSFDKAMLHYRGPETEMGVITSKPVELEWPYYDTALMSWVHNELERAKLKSLMEVHLGWEPLEFSDIAKIPFGNLPVEVAYPYACQDAFGTYKLAEFYTGGAIHPKGLELLQKIEQPVEDVFVEMGFRGWPTDMHLLRQYRAACSEVIKALQARIQGMLSAQGIEPFKLGAHAKLKSALAKLGHPVPDVTYLTLLGVDHPIARDIVALRTFERLDGTYLNAMEKHTWSQDGRVHPRFIQWEWSDARKSGKSGRAATGGAVTGRSSAQEPPVQTFFRVPVSIPTNLGLPAWVTDMVEINIRKTWKAPPGWAFVKTDASQIEMRISAAMTGEPLLLETYAQGGNVYSRVGEDAIGQPVVKGSTEYSCFKAIVLGIGYGSGPDTVQIQLLEQGIPMALETVQENHMAVTNKLPQMTMMFPLAVAQEISTLGFTESVFGRRRHFPQWHPRDRGMLRQAVNFKMGQSPAFDIMKVAMVDMAARVKQQKLKGYLCGQIHDEIMVLCPLDEVDTFASNMREALTRPIREYSPDFPYEVPLDCEVEWGENYGELKKWLPSEAVAPQTIVLEDPRAKYIEVIRDLLPCQKCNFFEYTGWVKVPGEGSVKPPVKLLWLGAMPGPEDVTQMRPFAGRPGSRLRQEAYISGLPMPPEEGVLALNALWCWNEHSEGITNNHISNCRPYLDRILEICRPQLIVALGSVAMRSILRCREAGVENNLGWHTLPDGARVMVTYHPAFILRSPGFGPEWRKHLNEVKVALEAL